MSLTETCFYSQLYVMFFGRNVGLKKSFRLCLTFRYYLNGLALKSLHIWEFTVWNKSLCPVRDYPVRDFWHTHRSIMGITEYVPEESSKDFLQLKGKLQVGQWGTFEI